MNAKSRAWERLKAELKPSPEKQTDPNKETLLQRFHRVTKTPLPKRSPAPKAA